MNTIFSYIIAEENRYNSHGVSIVDNWEWKMREHIELTIKYKNSTFKKGKDENKPFKNIIRPILNLQYRAEGFDVKDIELFVNNKEEYYKSFLVKKFHEKWARQNNLDTFIDNLVESYVDFGGALVKNGDEKPEVIPLVSLAFCDQTDILSGAFGIKHYYSPDQLKQMEANGWKNVDELILLSRAEKDDKAAQTKIETTSTYIEIYEVHGSLPDYFLDPTKDTYGEVSYTPQMHIVGFYHDKDNHKQGVTLWNGKEPKGMFKLLLRDGVYGRALGLGGAEELFEPQVWVNYSEIRKKEMLDSATKVLLKTTDSGLAARHPTGLKDLDNMELLVLEDGKDVGQLDTTPRSIALFERAVNEWEAHARTMGGANEAILGESPKSGTPFALQELVVNEAHSLHKYRQGKIATFVDEIYRDWVIPRIVGEINKGVEFLAELTLKELQNIAETITENRGNEFVKEKILSGEIVTMEEVESFKELERERIMSGGNKKFIKFLRNELRKAPVDVYTNIAGKQKYINETVKNLTNIFRQVISNPTALEQSPYLADLFNQILEYSNLSPVDIPIGKKSVPLMPQQNPQLQAPNALELA